MCIYLIYILLHDQYTLGCSINTWHLDVTLAENTPMACPRPTEIRGAVAVYSMIVQIACFLGLAIPIPTLISRIQQHASSVCLTYIVDNIGTHINEHTSCLGMSLLYMCWNLNTASRGVIPDKINMMDHTL